MNSRRASQESQGLAVGWVDRVEEAKDVWKVETICRHFYL